MNVRLCFQMTPIFQLSKQSDNQKKFKQDLKLLVNFMFRLLASMG